MLAGVAVLRSACAFLMISTRLSSRETSYVLFGDVEKNPSIIFFGVPANLTKPNFASHVQGSNGHISAQPDPRVRAAAPMLDSDPLAGGSSLLRKHSSPSGLAPDQLL
jgi:hypothetical protein